MATDEMEMSPTPSRATSQTLDSLFHLRPTYSNDSTEHDRRALPQVPNQGITISTENGDALASTEDFSEALPEDRLTPIALPEGYDELNARPLVLENWVLGIILSFNFLSLAAVVTTICRAGKDGQYRTTYGDIRYIVRYVPSIVGTVSQLSSRAVFFAYARIDPYLSMADSKDGRVRCHTTGDRSVGTPYLPSGAYPEHPFRVGRYLRFGAIMSQFVASFLTAFKSGFLSSTALLNGEYVVTVHPTLGLTLIGIYVVNMAVMLWILWALSSSITGLKWDPVTIADQLALFHATNVLDDFEELEHQPEKLAFKILQKREYRIGYWIRGADEANIVYGIGRATAGTVKQDERNITAVRERGIRRRIPLHRGARSDQVLETSCSGTLHVAFCRCRQAYHSSKYPHAHNPVYARWAILFWGAFVYFALGFYAYGFWKRVDDHDFSIKNRLYIHHPDNTAPQPGVDTNATAVAGQFWIDVGSLRSGAAHDLIIYVLLFRALPVYIASFFAAGFMGNVDLGVRFSQPFANMFKKEASAEDTILLNYVWGIPGAVTIEALKRKHLKVAWFSFLNLFNAYFPILVSGLFTITNTGPRIVFHVDDVSFYLCFVFVVIYSVSLPFAWPRRKRLLPRYCYSIADTLSLCYASSLMQNTALNISARNVTQRHLESRLFLQEEKLGMGMFTGRDGNRHFGFDHCYRRNQRDENVSHVRHASRKLWRYEVGHDPLEEDLEHT